MKNDPIQKIIDAMTDVTEIEIGRDISCKELEELSKCPVHTRMYCFLPERCDSVYDLELNYKAKRDLYILRSPMHKVKLLVKAQNEKSFIRLIIIPHKMGIALLLAFVLFVLLLELICLILGGCFLLEPLLFLIIAIAFVVLSYKISVKNYQKDFIDVVHKVLKI